MSPRKSIGDEDKLIKRNRIAFYLGIFWVKPNKNPDFKKQVQWLHQDSKKNRFQAVYVPGLDKLKQAGQAIVLAYEDSIRWRAFNTYELVDLFIQGESVIGLTQDLDLVVIYHGAGEMPNKQLHNITKQVVENRTMRGKRTVFLSTYKDTNFGFMYKNLTQASVDSNGLSSSTEYDI